MVNHLELLTAWYNTVTRQEELKAWRLKAPSVTCAAILDDLVWEDYALCSSKQNLQFENASTGRPSYKLFFGPKGQRTVTLL